MKNVYILSEYIVIKDLYDFVKMVVEIIKEV